MIEEAKRRINQNDKNKSRSLDLKCLNLKDIPVEVFELTHLRDLKLSSNNLSQIPDDIRNLQNLRRIHLSCNDFQEFPNILLELPHLEHICLNSNYLQSIPKEISKLTKLKELQLNGNEISSLPCELLNCNFSELSCSRNPLKSGNEVIRARGSFQVYKHLLNNLLGRSFVFTVPKEIQTPIKTYLLSFTSFIKDVKGLDINVETRTVGEGLSIDVKMSDDIDDDSFNQYLFEYMELGTRGLAKEEIEIEYTVEKSDEEKSMIEHKLNQNISILEIQLRQSEFENTYLKGMLDKLIAKESRPVTLYVNQQLLNSPTTNINVADQTNSFRDEFLELIKDLKEAGIAEELISDAQVIEEIDEQNPGKNESQWSRINNFLKKCLSRGEKITDAIDRVSNGYERILNSYEKLQNLLKSIGINPEELISNL